MQEVIQHISYSTFGVSSSLEISLLSRYISYSCHFKYQRVEFITNNDSPGTSSSLKRVQLANQGKILHIQYQKRGYSNSKALSNYLGTAYAYFVQIFIVSSLFCYCCVAIVSILPLPMLYCSGKLCNAISFCLRYLPRLDSAAK